MNRDLVVGVDLGGTKVLAEVISPKDEVLSRSKDETPYESGARALLAAIAGVIEKSLEEAGAARGRIAAIGMGSPGPLDPERGLLLRTPHIDVRNVPLGARLRKEFGVPVVLDNDVHMALLGECRAGSGRGFQHVVGIWVGTGVGGAVVLNGKVVHGANKNAGEIGHMYLDAKRARAGREKGTLEWEASKTGMARRLRKKLGQRARSRLAQEVRGKGRLHSSILADAFRNGERAAVEAIEHSARYVGIAVANLYDALSPELFIVGGGVAEDLGRVYVERVRKTAREFAFSTELARPNVVASKLGDDAGPIGAAAAAREALASASR